MAPDVLHRVLPLAERHVRRRLQNSGTTLKRALAMRINIVNANMQKLAYVTGVGRPKFAALTTEHERAVGDVELRMEHLVIGTGNTQAFPEAEGAAQPRNRLTHIFIDEDGYHRCPGC